MSGSSAGAEKMTFLTVPPPMCFLASSAFLNLPVDSTTTGAARAVGLVMPELKGKIDGIAIRIPTPNVSLVDLVAVMKNEVTEKDVNDAFRKAAEGRLKGILEYSEEPLVSCDVLANSHSAVVDGLSTKVIEKNLLKVLAWYDNEWGYSCRLRDLIKFVTR